MRESLNRAADMGWQQVMLVGDLYCARFGFVKLADVEMPPPPIPTACWGWSWSRVHGPASAAISSASRRLAPDPASQESVGEPASAFGGFLSVPPL